MRYNKHRRDANHKAICEGLRKYGVTVKDTSQYSGFCDLMCIFRNKIYFLEVKNPTASPSHKKLTKAEAEFHRIFRDHVTTVETIEEALVAVGVSFKRVKEDRSIGEKSKLF